MKFLFKKRTQEDLQKISSIQEQLENINSLIDPLEKALLLEKLRDRADGMKCGISGRIHDNCVLLGFGGGLVMVAGMVTAAPLAMVLGCFTAVGTLMFGDLFQKPEEKVYETIIGQIDTTLKTITKQTCLEACAASPQLGEALRHFPILRERFEDAANMERYQKMLSPAAQQTPIIAHAIKNPLKPLKTLTLNNKDGKGPTDGFQL